MLKIYDKSVDTDKFIQFLKSIRQKYPFKRLALFQDNLTVHLSKKTKAAYTRYQLETIQNAPMFPDGNGVESFIGIGKNQVKQIRLNAFANGQDIDLDVEIYSAFKAIGQDIC